MCIICVKQKNFTHIFSGDYMEENIKLVMLYDIYGKLLTKKQQSIFEEYFLYNLSLREIAENKKISYQAVRDSIKKSKKMLESYEEAIGMAFLQNNIEKIKSMCDKNINLDKDEIISLLNIKK